MVSPIITADNASVPTVAKRRPQGVVAQRGIAIIPATTAADTVVGMIRFQKGFVPISLTIKSDDLDNATNVLLDVGYVYDEVAFTDDDNAFLDNIDIAQDAGSLLWPVADGLLTGVGFEAEGDGYLVVVTRAAATTTLGNITLTCSFTYDRE